MDEQLFSEVFEGLFFYYVQWILDQRRMKTAVVSYDSINTFFFFCSPEILKEIKACSYNQSKDEDNS